MRLILDWAWDLDPEDKCSIRKPQGLTSHPMSRPERGHFLDYATIFVPFKPQPQD